MADGDGPRKRGAGGLKNLPTARAETADAAGSAGERRLGRRERLDRWALTAILALCVLYLLPSNPKYLDTSIDGSWGATLHHFALSDLQFGRDLVYTFGPFGFLAQRLYWPRTYWLLCGWTALLAIGLCAAFRRIVLDLDVPMKALAGLGFFLLLAVTLATDLHLFLLLLLFVGLALGKGSARVTPLELFVLMLLAVAALMKFVHFVAVPWVVVLSAAAVSLRCGRICRAPVYLALFVLALWVAAGQRLAGLPAYFRNASEIAAGYAEAMLTTGSGWESAALLAGMGLTLVSLTLADLDGSRGRRVLWLLAIAGLFLISFKLGSIRQQGTRISVPWVLTTAVAWLAVALPARSKSSPAALWSVRWIVAGLATLALMVMAELRFEERISGRLVAARHRPFASLRLMRALWSDPDTLRRWHRQRIDEIVAGNPLPPLPGTVDLYGDAAAILLAHGLDYRPRPVFQSFSVFTPRLARLNRDFYRSAAAPDWVVVRLEPFRKLPPGFRDSESLLELYSGYEPVKAANQLLVLRRRPPAARRPFFTGISEERSLSLGESWRMDRTRFGPAVWAEIEVARTPLGKLAHLLYNAPALKLELKFADGRRLKARFPANGTGFLLSPAVWGTGQLGRDLRQGLDAAPKHRIVTRLRLATMGDGQWAYGRVRVRLTALSQEPPS